LGIWRLQTFRWALSKTPQEQAMTKRPVNFYDEPAAPQPRAFWIPRMMITGIMVGLASAYLYLHGYRVF
jgi:hypothetical protein